MTAKKQGCQQLCRLVPILFILHHFFLVVFFQSILFVVLFLANRKIIINCFFFLPLYIYQKFDSGLRTRLIFIRFQIRNQLILANVSSLLKFSLVQVWQKYQFFRVRLQTDKNMSTFRLNLFLFEYSMLLF